MRRMLRSNVVRSQKSSCTKLEPKEHIVAYIEDREILRDFDPLPCDDQLLESLISNYIIVKRILANLAWQDQILSKSVCRMWRDAVLTLQREQFSPYDFVCTQVLKRSQISFAQSDNFGMEPLAIFVFINESAFSSKFECKDISPSPCSPNCENSHCLLDVIYHSVCFPKKCLLFIKCSILAYMPKSQSKTYKYTVNRHMLGTTTPLLAGLYLPKIPNVELHLINVKSTATENLQDFYNEVNRISETRYFKAILVFVTDKFLFQSENDMLFLNYFKEIQKDMSYALGGCLIDDTLHDPNDLPMLVDRIDKDRPFVTEDVISIAMFSVAKDTPENISTNTCFEAYSLVIDTSDWSKVRIQKTVNEFAGKVPRFEYSMALKLSCVGRDNRHEAEQDVFRAAFPHTPIAGCYGNGEIGHNHPPRSDPPDPNDITKRFKKDPVRYGGGLVHSYSTIFVYFGWGKML